MSIKDEYSCTPILANSPPSWRLSKQEGKPKQLDLFPPPIPAPPNRQKPQIASIPGTSPKDPNRYKVMIGGTAIASELSCNDAAQLAILIKQKQLTPAIDFLQEKGIFSKEVQLFLLSAISQGGGR